MDYKAQRNRRQKNREIPTKEGRPPKFDPIHPRDFNSVQLAICCEDCSYFDSKQDACILGYQTKWHKREMLLKCYNLGGKAPLCRFVEID